MNDLLRILLPIGFVLFVGLAMVLRSWLTYRRTGKNPLVLPRDDSAYGYIGRMLKILTAGFLIDIVVFEFGERAYRWLVPIPYLERDELRVAGIVLFVVSLIWLWIAQANLGASWRIGIDTANRTDLIEHGLYRISRNPIYVGMFGAFAALLLLLPNAFTLLVVGLSFVLVNIQTRLEEDHLTRMHGDAYKDYCHRVRRWL